MTRVSQQKDKIHLKNRIASPSKTVLYILAFIIPLLLVLISFARSNFAPFGDKDVITASGDNNYYVYYYELYDHVHSPDLFTKTEENNISSLFASESISGNSYITDLAYHISIQLIILFFFLTVAIFQPFWTSSTLLSSPLQASSSASIYQSTLQIELLTLKKQLIRTSRQKKKIKKIH